MENVNVSTLVTSPLPAATASRRKQAKPQPQRIEEDVNASSPSISDEAVSQEEIQAKQEIPSFFGAPLEAGDVVACTAPQTDALHHTNTTADEDEGEGDGEDDNRPTRADKNDTNSSATVTSNITHRALLQQPPSVADLQGLSMEALRSKITELCSAMQLSYSVYNDLTHLLGNGGGGVSGTVRSTTTKADLSTQKVSAGEQSDETENQNRDESHEKQTVTDCSASEASAEKIQHHHDTSSSNELISPRVNSDDRAGLSETGEENGVPSDNGYRHRCPYCTKAFPGLSALTIHVRSHTGEKPYQCNYCLHRFTTKGNLKVHVQRHVEKGDQPLSPARFDSNFFPGSSATDHNNRCCSESPPPSSSGAPPPPPPSQAEAQQQVVAPLLLSNVVATNTHTSSSLLTVPHFATPHSKILPPQLSLVPPSPHNWPVVPTSLLTPASTITTSTNTFMSAPTSSSYPLSASFLPSPISPAFSAAAVATAAASSGVLPPHVLAALFNSHFNSALAQQQAASGVSSSQTTLAAVATGAMAQPNVAAPLPFANNIPTPFSPQILSSFMWAAAAAAAQRNQVAAATHGHALTSTVPSTAAPTLTSCPTLQRSRPSSSASINSARTHHTTANDNKPSASAAVVVPPALPFSMFQSLPHSGGSNSFQPSIIFSPTTMHRLPSTSSSSSSIMSPFPSSSFPFGTSGNGILPFPLLRPSATSTSNFTSSLPSTTLPLPFSGPNFGAFARPLVPPMFNMFAPPQSTNSNDSLSSNINNINTNGSGKRYDPLLDPIVFTALLPQPGSNDNAWEQLMIVDDSPESTRLLALMDTMLDKLSDPNQCIVCKRILSCKSALVMHYRTHTGERPFRCRLCSRAFTTKGNLKTHMGVHRVKLPLRPFIECPVCVRPFNDISILQQHIRAHAHMGQLGVPPPGQSSSSLPGDEEDEIGLDEQEDELVQPQQHQPAVVLGATDADIDCVKSSSRTEEPALVAEDGDAGEKPKKPESPPHIFDDENGSVTQLNRAVTVVDVPSTRSHSNPLDKAEEDPSMRDEHGQRKRHLSSDDDVAIDERHKRSRSVSAAYIHSVEEKKQAVDGPQPEVQRETEDDAALVKPASNVDDPSTAALDTTKEAGNEPDNIKTEAECGTNTVTCKAENKSATSAFAGIEDLIKRTTAELGRSPLVASLMPFGLSLPHSTASLLNIPTNSAGVNATPSQSSAFDRPNLRPNYTSSLPASATAAHWPALRLPPPQQLGSFSTHNGEDVYRHHSTNNSNSHQTPMITPELAALMQQKARNTTCNICFKTFACQSALQIHYRSHTKERPFKCPTCSRGFTTKGNMKQHLLTHKIRDMPTNNHQHHQQNSTTSSSASPIPLSTSVCTHHTTKDGGNGSEMPRNPFNNFPTFYANEMQHRLATVMRQQQQMSNPFLSPFQHLRANGVRAGEQRERSQFGSMRQPTPTENDDEDDDVEIEVVDQQLHVGEDENVSSRPVSLPSKATSCNNVIQQRVGTTSVSPALDEAAAAQDNTGSPPDGEQRARARSSTRPQTRFQQEQHQRTSRSELEKPRTCASSPFETTCVHGVQASEGSQYRLLVVCRKCDKSFGSNSALDVHMQTTHAGERPFMCPHKDCERAFTTKGNLKVHLASHDSLPHQTSYFPQSTPHSVPRRHPLKPSTFLPPSLLTTSVFTATEAAGDCRTNIAGENGREEPQSFSTAGGLENSPLNKAVFAQHPPLNGPNNVSTLTNPMFSAAARAALFSTARNGVVNCPLPFQLPTAAMPANLAAANASAAAAAIAAVQTRAVFSSFMANLTNSNMLVQYAQMLAQMNNSKLHHLSTGVPTNVSSSVSTSSPPPAPVEVDDDVKHTDVNSMYRTSERITCGGGEDDQENDDVEVDD